MSGTRSDGVSCFRRIPYAQPPTGALRWMPPVASFVETSIDGTRPGPIAPQNPSRLRGAMGDFVAEQSEDCLHLTVWTPAVDAARRPVIVWLHGGAWQSGAGALDWYSGANLARRGDLVVVAPNYRLGPLGWLTLPDHSSNLGLLDQEMAIQWVADHIDRFGGDPNNITVMGQSAGAGSAVCMLMRDARFNRAILQSAPLGRTSRTLPQAKRLGEAFLRAANCSSVNDARQLDFRALLQVERSAEMLAALDEEASGLSMYRPVADGVVLPRDMESNMARAASIVDTIVGSTAEEMRAFPSDASAEAMARAGREVFVAPCAAWAREAACHGRSAWVYSFAYGPSQAFGACHCIELPFVFDTFDSFVDAPMLEGLNPSKARSISNDMQSAWIGFARGQSPGWSAGGETRRFA